MYILYSIGYVLGVAYGTDDPGDPWWGKWSSGAERRANLMTQLIIVRIRHVTWLDAEACAEPPSYIVCINVG